MWEELQPTGPLEALLVEEIVAGYWRLRRVLRSEWAMARRPCKLLMTSADVMSRPGRSPMPWPPWSACRAAAAVSPCRRP